MFLSIMFLNDSEKLMPFAAAVLRQVPGSPVDLPLPVMLVCSTMHLASVHQKYLLDMSA
jgi:hypothetical protein